MVTQFLLLDHNMHYIHNGNKLFELVSRISFYPSLGPTSDSGMLASRCPPRPLFWEWAASLNSVTGREVNNERVQEEDYCALESSRTISHSIPIVRTVSHPMT